MREEIEKIIVEVLEGYSIDKAVDKLFNLYNVVKRYKFEFEYKCQITKTYKEIEYVTWADSEDKAWDNLKEEYPTARGIYITKY